jgi:hypothetical protein
MQQYASSPISFFKSVPEKNMSVTGEKQSEFFTALSNGDIEKVKHLLDKVNFLQPAPDGRYPLEIAIYSTNPDTINYIIWQLTSKEALEVQYQALDREKAKQYIETQIPINLLPQVTCLELAQWYNQNANKTWVKQYDKEVEKEMKKKMNKEMKLCWAEENWGKRRTSPVHEGLPFKYPLKYYKDPYLPNCTDILMDAPSREIHDNVIMLIYEQLDRLQTMLDQRPENWINPIENNRKEQVVKTAM